MHGSDHFLPPSGSLRKVGREGGCGEYLLLVQDDGELDTSRTEAVGGLWVEWEDLSRSSCQEYRPSSGLGYPVLTGLEYSKCTLKKEK